ncbi:hypothetical protein NC653_038236 [Populus alba x Populus x berolinensis]|nr:hypothetical protein NC653_038236 [Populus alba x Populus x berolinensis]
MFKLLKNLLQAWMLRDFQSSLNIETKEVVERQRKSLKKRQSGSFSKLDLTGAISKEMINLSSILFVQFLHFVSIPRLYANFKRLLFSIRNKIDIKKDILCNEELTSLHDLHKSCQEASKNLDLYYQLEKEYDVSGIPLVKLLNCCVH